MHVYRACGYAHVYIICICGHEHGIQGGFQGLASRINRKQCRTRQLMPPPPPPPPPPPGPRVYTPVSLGQPRWKLFVLVTSEFSPFITERLAQIEKNQHADCKTRRTSVPRVTCRADWITVSYRTQTYWTLCSKIRPYTLYSGKAILL